MQRMDFAKIVKQHYLEKPVMPFRSVAATVYTSRSTGRLKLNKAALQLMDIKPGESLYFFDLSADEKAINERLFLTKGFEFDNQIMGSRLLTGGILNNSILYNTIMSEGRLTEFDNLQMVEDGYFLRNGKEKYLAIKKTIMTIERYIEYGENNIPIDMFAPAPGISPQPFFLLKNWMINDYIKDTTFIR